MGDEQDNLLTAGPGWGLGHAGRAGGSGGATGGAVAGGWGQAGGSGQGWWFGGSPHEGSGSEQEGLRVPQAQGSGDRQGQWLEGFWWYTHVGTVPGDVWRCHRWHGGPGVGTGRDSGPGGLQCCWHRPCLCSRSGDREGGQRGGDRTGQRGFQSASSPRSTQGDGEEENRIHSGEEQGAGGAVAAPHRRAPAGQEPPGNAMRTATKPATGRGSRPGRGRGQRRGWPGAAATPWPGR